VQLTDRIKILTWWWFKAGILNFDVVVA